MTTATKKETAKNTKALKLIDEMQKALDNDEVGSQDEIYALLTKLHNKLAQLKKVV